MQGIRRHAPLCLGLAAVLLSPRAASAYACEALVTKGCHEHITSEALRRVRAEPEVAPALGGTRDERALIDDVQFDLQDDMRDLGAVSLLLGVRDNDLKGLSVDDLSAIAQVHGDPAHQDEHCLRGPGQGEPGGSEAALAACVAFIRGRVVEALEGLDTDGRPDRSVRTSLRVHLSLRGQVDASLPLYYVRMGQALHTLQDSFAHAYRTPDDMKVTVVLDWLDAAQGTLVESRDGPAHAAGMDECVGVDDVLSRKRELATQASTELLLATLGSARTHDEKVADVGKVLDRYLGYSPGCTFDNDWCDAVERNYAGASGVGCSVGGRSAPRGSDLGLALMALVGLALLRRTGRRAALAGLVSAVVIAGTLAASTARADEGPAVETGGLASEGGIPAPVTVPVAEPGPLDPSETAIGAYLGGFGSISKGAVGASLGLRLRVSRHWTFGVDGEWNPWLAFNGPTPIRKGVINLYGTAMLRFPLAYESFNLATTVNLGVSYLLDDLYGAASGSMGPYLGVSPLGLEWKLSSNFLLVINPLSFALPIPKVSGVPLWFPQYRFSIGIAVMAG